LSYRTYSLISRDCIDITNAESKVQIMDLYWM